MAGEHAYPVPLLDVPPQSVSPTAAQAVEHSAVQLFVERAAAALGRYSLTDETAPIVAKICRRLDGIPLAIELAAPRLKVLTPEALQTRLDDQLRLLTAGSRVAAPRQQTLRAAIEWSYALLSETEQAMLCRLGVFAGSFTLEAVAAVAVGAPVGASDVFDVLAGLVEKSLVVSLGGGGENRYRLLEFNEGVRVGEAGGRQLRQAPRGEDRRRRLRGRPRLGARSGPEAVQGRLPAAAQLVGGANDPRRLRRRRPGAGGVRRGDPGGALRHRAARASTDRPCCSSRGPAP